MHAKGIPGADLLGEVNNEKAFTALLLNRGIQPGTAFKYGDVVTGGSSSGRIFFTETMPWCTNARALPRPLNVTEVGRQHFNKKALDQTRIESIPSIDTPEKGWEVWIAHPDGVLIVILLAAWIKVPPE